MKITNNEKKIIVKERVKKLEQTLNELVKELKTEEHCISFGPIPRRVKLIKEMKNDYEILCEALEELDGE